jgi:hypothetical protein
VFFYASQTDVHLPDDLRRELEAAFGVFDGESMHSTS